MTTFYLMGTDEDTRLLAEVLTKWHADLAEHDVKIAFVRAQRADDEPAVRHHGYPALATVRVVPLKDRLLKGCDAELLVDESAFRQLSSKAKLALLDHEMTHLALRRDRQTGQVKTDDLGRPKLRTRKGDWNAGDGFGEVCQRHGEQAIEFENLRLAFGRAQEATQRKQMS